MILKVVQFFSRCFPFLARASCVQLNHPYSCFIPILLGFFCLFLCWQCCYWLLCYYYYYYYYYYYINTSFKYFGIYIYLYIYIYLLWKFCFSYTLFWFYVGFEKSFRFNQERDRYIYSFFFKFDKGLKKTVCWIAGWIFRICLCFMALWYSCLVRLRTYWRTIVSPFSTLLVIFLSKIDFFFFVYSWNFPSNFFIWMKDADKTYFH